MLTIQSNVSLKPYNTFGIEAQTRYLVEISHENDLPALLLLNDFVDVPKLILGGGSNVLLRRDFDGLVVKMAIQGIELVREDEDHIYLSVGAGVNWHQLVDYCVAHGYAGMENLSLIPGTVGAAPMQNIGAYGVEIEQIFESLTAVHIPTGEYRTFMHSDCAFGYRDIQETLDTMGIPEDKLSIQAISDAVIHIRRSKLPDPAQIGNAGSFFKNPEIPAEQFARLKETYPDIPGYPLADGGVKLPAGWLIERAGWKGYRKGDAGVHARQALVLVNYGGATGDELIALAQQVQASVYEKYGVQIQPEVNVI